MPAKERKYQLLRPIVLPAAIVLFALMIAAALFSREGANWRLLVGLQFALGFAICLASDMRDGLGFRKDPDISFRDAIAMSIVGAAISISAITALVMNNTSLLRVLFIAITATFGFKVTFVELRTRAHRRTLASSPGSH